MLPDAIGSVAILYVSNVIISTALVCLFVLMNAMHKKMNALQNGGYYKRVDERLLDLEFMVGHLSRTNMAICNELGWEIFDGCGISPKGN